MPKQIHVHVHRTKDSLESDYRAEVAQLQKVFDEASKLKHPTYRMELKNLAAKFFDQATQEYKSLVAKG